MGGEGAKDRRRLRREGQSPQPPSPGNLSKNRHHPKAEDTAANARGSKPTSDAGRVRPHQKTGAADAAATKKMKKPKHLKRKLAALEAEQGSGEASDHRRRLQQQLEKWERGKQAYLRAKEQRKRQRQELLSQAPSEEARNHNKRPTSHSASADAANNRRQQTRRGSSRRTDQATDVSSEEASNRFPRGKTYSNAANTESSHQAAKDQSLEVNRTTTTTIPHGQPAALPLTVDGQTPTPGSDSDDDDGSDVEVKPVAAKRERGKRRRGRQAGGGMDGGSGEAPPTSAQAVKVSNGPPPETDGHGDDTVTASAPERASFAAKPNDAGGAKGRYCLGRKPVTDFVVGQTYEGKVVYVKPFGMFLDVGCHSDAFCHVSRLSDDYVESPEALFHPGDAVVARVVEIDRQHKRITVSLQSEARMADEIASMEAKRERRRHRQRQQAPHRTKGEVPLQPPFANTSAPSTGASEKERDRPPPFRESSPRPPSASDDATPGPPRLGNNPTPRELKRARKLERRAARRAEAGVETGASQ